MRDPRRITEARTGELESDLLRAMREDAPSARARHRTLAALGVGGAALGIAASTTSAAAATSSKLPALAWLAVSKWLGIGIVSGLATMGLVHEIPKRATLDAGNAAPSVQRTPERKVLGKGVQTSLSIRESDVPAPVPVSELPLEVARETPQHPKSAKVGLIAENSKPELAAEVVSLDGARQATLAEEPVRALELLDAHEKRFPRGALSPEVLVLRIEALAASGRKQTAISLGRQFLDAHATSPHAEKVRALIASDATH